MTDGDAGNEDFNATITSMFQNVKKSMNTLREHIGISH